MRIVIYLGVVYFALCGFFIQSAYARVQGMGVVSIDGKILESPCSIDTGSRDQTIEMGDASVGAVVREGHGPSKPFSILLRNCRLHQNGDIHNPVWGGVRVVFDGDSEQGLYRIEGGAKGVGLQLFDSNGNIYRLGEPALMIPIVDDAIRLNYTLRLTGNNKPVKAGEYRAVSLKFRMDYD